MTWTRPIIYARVSRDDRTVAQQVEALRARYGANIPCVAEQESTRKDRPMQRDVMRRALAGEFDAILVWKLDRWARSTRELVDTVEDLRAAGVAFVSLEDGLDLSTSVGRFTFRLLAAVAELERDMISDRTKAKLASLRAAGKRLGRPPTYDVARAQQLAPRCRSHAELARRLGVSYDVARRLRHPRKGRGTGPTARLGHPNTDVSPCGTRTYVKTPGG